MLYLMTLRIFFEISMSGDIEYGKVYAKQGEYAVLSDVYSQKNIIGISSDTYGYGIGRNDNKTQIPIAVAGIVLSYVDKEYEIGTPLTSAPNGYLTEHLDNDKRLNPERTYATYYKKEKELYWNNILVNGRHWVKVK